MELDDPSIARCVGDKEDQAVRAEVALLQRCLALDELDIGETRLRFDQDHAEPAFDHAVATAKVSMDRHRYFDAPPQPRMQSALQAGEQSKMRPVTHRVTPGMQRQRKLQANDRRDAGREINGERARIGPLCPRDSRGADADAPRDLPNAQATSEAGR